MVGRSVADANGTGATVAIEMIEGLLEKVVAAIDAIHHVERAFVEFFAWHVRHSGRQVIGGPESLERHDRLCDDRTRSVPPPSARERAGEVDLAERTLPGRPETIEPFDRRSERRLGAGGVACGERCPSLEPVGERGDALRVGLLRMSTHPVEEPVDTVPAFGGGDELALGLERIALVHRPVGGSFQRASAHQIPRANEVPQQEGIQPAGRRALEGG